jgi:hypothetical protein
MADFGDGIAYQLALDLYQASQIEPGHLGPEIVKPDLDPDVQRAVALDYIATKVLPGALSEVSIPFRKATRYGDVKSFIAGAFPTMSEADQLVLVAEGEALYISAATSFGRSELNKRISSNAAAYDTDSDQDRIQGNQRLAKLLEWASDIIAGALSSTPPNPARVMHGGSVSNVYTW